MKVKIMYYNKQFENKPKGYENAEVQKKLKQTEIEIEDLAKGLSNGATFKPALLNGTKSSDWISQQIFALDFDHDTTIDEQINRCKYLNILPVFGYTSFSHSDKEHHFRLVFCSDTMIENIETRNRLQKTLIRIFDKSDKVTFDCTRLFYGGKHLISFDFDNRIDVEKIINTYCNDNNDNFIEQKKTKQPKQTTIKSNKEYMSNVQNHDRNMTLKIEAIKALNVDIMHFQLKSQSELYNYINSIDLSEYLGICGYVNCILPEHKDHSPSAHIYITNDGTQIYKCMGCGKAYTIISITEKLAHCKRSEAIEFIKKVYNIELIESDWTKTWKQKMIDSANYLDTEEFQMANPVLYKLIRTRKTHIQKILLHLTQYVNENMQVENKPFFFASYKTLMELCGIKGDKNKMSQTLTLFSLLNMIIKLQITDIPEKELNKAKSIAAKYHHKKLTGFYSFEEYGVNLLEPSEEIAKTLRANNMTLKGLSREYVLRTFGTELADKVYPQYKHENAQGTTKQSDERTSQIVECLFYCIEQKGYATEKDVVYLLSDKYKYQTTEIQLKKSLQEILISYDLAKVKASKVNKAKYNLPNDISYQTSVICKMINENEKEGNE